MENLTKNVLDLEHSELLGKGLTMLSLGVGIQISLLFDNPFKNINSGIIFIFFLTS